MDDAVSNFPNTLESCYLDFGYLELKAIPVIIDNTFTVVYYCLSPVALSGLIYLGANCDIP